MTKKEARQQIKDKIKQLDKQYIKEADQSIFDQIKELKEYKKKLDDDRKRKIRCAYFAEYLPMVRHFQGMY